MKNRPFGSTGVNLSIVGLGALPLAVDGRPSESDAVRVIHAALGAGMTWIDVADAYCAGEHDIGYGERLVARAVREWSGAREDVRISTKGGWMRPGGGWKINGRPEHLRAACEASLAALGVSSIFLYQLHRTDPSVPLAESLGALVDLKREGKIAHIGLSNVDAADLRRARSVAEIASVQNLFNCFDRECLSDGVLEACERYGIALVAHSPVGGHKGFGRVADDATLRAVAARHGLTPQQVAIAWLIGKSPAILTMPGARRVASVLSSAAAADVVLAAEDRAELDAAFPLPPTRSVKIAAMRREVRHLARRVRARIRYVARSRVRSQ
jgi:aryl-alcohol dehydrogenase-like predicted oxidoreductase